MRAAYSWAGDAETLALKLIAVAQAGGDELLVSKPGAPGAVELSLAYSWSVSRWVAGGEGIEEELVDAACAVATAEHKTRIGWRDGARGA